MVQRVAEAAEHYKALQPLLAVVSVIIVVDVQLYVPTAAVAKLAPVLRPRKHLVPEYPPLLRRPAVRSLRRRCASSSGAAGEAGERLEALYVLAVHTGMRQGELLALKW